MLVRRTALILGLASAGCAREQQQQPPPPEPAHTPAAEPAHWDYSGERGPATWGTLDTKYAVCGSGQAQSPIDIVGATRAANPVPVSSTYRAGPLQIVHHDHKSDIVNTGHSIQVNNPSADTLTVGADPYVLLQYHFHSPSEHQVAGASFPIEMHLVHRSAGGRLAVVGVLIREGKHNAAFDPVWSKLPATRGAQAVHDSVEVNVDNLLPKGRASYRYDGSLTTPPCSEGVKWIVLATPVELSAAQIAAFKAVLSGNNRPVQPLNGRNLMEIPDR